jgi:hypothetical protein
MDELIQTEKCSIIYGKFQGKPNQELFRCPRALDDTDLPRYVNDSRCLLGFEADTETEDLKGSDDYIGYYRLYFRGGWHGSWIENNGVDDCDCVGIDTIVEWFQETFPRGCSFVMQEYLSQYPQWGAENRYLLKPLYSKHYKVFFDTTYGNGDYPVRIYVYK